MIGELREAGFLIARGLKSHVLGSRHVEAGGIQSARYSYTVWMRHLVNVARFGLGAPRVVAELGPGVSLGVGICALLTGAERYCALDLVRHTEIDANVNVVEELVDLLRQRAPIPSEFPGVRPLLDDYSFPFHILSDERLAASLEPERVGAIRNSLVAGGDAVRFFAPWNSIEAPEKGTVDLVVSQAVLEHVDDLEGVYAAAWEWLAPGGGMSNQIDFSSHDITQAWNGHWAYGDPIWSVIRGGLPYLLNRRPYEYHLEQMSQTGFRVLCDERQTKGAGIDRRRLASQFRAITDADLGTCGAYVLAIKPDGKVRWPSPLAQ